MGAFSIIVKKPRYSIDLGLNFSFYVFFCRFFLCRFFCLLCLEFILDFTLNFRVFISSLTLYRHHYHFQSIFYSLTLRYWSVAAKSSQYIFLFKTTLFLLLWLLTLFSLFCLYWLTLYFLKRGQFFIEFNQIPVFILHPDRNFGAFLLLRFRFGFSLFDNSIWLL